MNNYKVGQKTVLQFLRTLDSTFPAWQCRGGVSIRHPDDPGLYAHDGHGMRAVIDLDYSGPMPHRDEAWEVTIGPSVEICGGCYTVTSVTPLQKVAGAYGRNVYSVLVDPPSGCKPPRKKHSHEEAVEKMLNALKDNPQYPMYKTESWK